VIIKGGESREKLGEAGNTGVGLEKKKKKKGIEKTSEPRGINKTQQRRPGCVF